MKQYTLITGASSGIGRELAYIAAREKRNLVLVARDATKLKAVRSKILTQARDTSPQIEILAIDLSKNESSKAVYEFCKNKKIHVNELINNAGFGDYGNFAKSDLQRQLSMIDLNIGAVTELTHRFLPAMIKNGSGKIMNLGSIASFLPGPSMNVYFASKNYVIRFSEALSEELRGSGVSVTCLCPGPTKSSFGSSANVSTNHSTANPRTTALEVAEYGWKKMQKGASVAIYGFGNKLMVQMLKIIPRSIIVKIVSRLQG